MASHSMDDTLVRARTLVIDLERHIDRASAERDLAEVGRAWVRAAQLERALRSLLPDGATSGLDVPDAEITDTK
jgi:hypothetical protein